MKLKVDRTVKKFSSETKDYGKVIIVSEALSPFIGKTITIQIEVKETDEENK